MLGIKQNTGLVGQDWVFLKSLPSSLLHSCQPMFLRTNSMPTRIPVWGGVKKETLFSSNHSDTAWLWKQRCCGTAQL